MMQIYILTGILAVLLIVSAICVTQLERAQGHEEGDERWQDGN